MEVARKRRQYVEGPHGEPQKIVIRGCNSYAYAHVKKMQQPGYDRSDPNGIKKARQVRKEFTSRKLEGETLFKKNGGFTPGHA